MSGKNCIDFGGVTLEVRSCADLNAGEAEGDNYGGICIVKKGDGAGTIVDRRGNTVFIDPSTSQEDKQKGTLKLTDPVTGSLLTAEGLPSVVVVSTSKNQGKNTTSFELCEAGDPYKTLITYNDGRAAQIDTTAKSVKGQLTFLSPDGKTGRTVSGLTEEEVKLNADLQGAELGECTGDKKFLSRLPLHASGSSSILSWTVKDQRYLRENIGGDTDVAFFCSDEKTGQAVTEAGALGTRLVVNLNPGKLNDVRYFIDTVLRQGVEAGSCGPLDATKCGAAFESLRKDFNSLQSQDRIEPLTTGWDKFWSGAWKVGEIAGAFVLGVLVFTVGGRGSECSNKVGGFGHPLELMKCLWKNPPPVSTPVAPPEKAPEAHRIGVEAPVLLGTALAVKAAPSLWAGFFETVGAIGQGAMELAGAAATVTVPFVIIPDDDPFFGAQQRTYYGPQPEQVWY